METDDRRLQVDVLLKQLDALRARTKGLKDAQDRLLGIGLTTLAALLAYGLQTGNLHVVALHPYLLFALLLYAEEIVRDMMSLAGQKEHVEEQLNRLVGKRILYREVILREDTRRRSTALRALFALFLALLATSVAASFLAILGAWGLPWAVASAAACLALAAACVVAYHEARAAHGRMRRACERKAGEAWTAGPKGAEPVPISVSADAPPAK